ncbi:pentapeptide repeat-containing protein [Motilimonas cestriensis]|uniref:Pentapeptide repeat-containing protein n=1 Tax=Motilimonas cestriensis TaxID=2742685 RepID=A0ABS8WAN8_9GAMM|nr:pentapeptide repeat-containing protein [Motilimonas cestriensis]MCE2595298.1 pentapeptide repeat-containing protein [Motilimonas cestriensis]
MFNHHTQYVDETFDQLISPDSYHSLTFEDCSFERCDFSEASFNRCQFIRCNFLQCNLSNISILGCQFNQVSFAACKMLGIDWTQVLWLDYVFDQTVSFKSCLVSDSTFFGLSLDELTLKDCKAHRVDFREGSFCRADFSGSDFHGSQFGQTNLTQANFVGAENYHMDITHNRLHKAKFSRYEAICLLSHLDIELVD